MALKIESIGLMLVATVLLAIQPSTCSPIEDEKLAALSERFDKLQTKVESLEAEHEGFKIQMGNLQIKLDHLEEKEAKNEAKISQQEKEIIQLKAKTDAKLETIQSTGLSHDEKVTDLPTSKVNQMRDIYRNESSPSDYSTKAFVPSSCRELSLIGHTLNGLYLVQNLNTRKVETVLCTFGSSVKEDLIGNVDVKTINVHFYVQRNSSFNSVNAVIPFEFERLNEGRAFDLTSGVFTAPVKGIYHFDFSAIKSLAADYLAIYLQVNGANICRVVTYTSATESNNVVSLSASLRLAAGDKVNLLNSYTGSLIDGPLDRFTNFSGWLIEEDLV